MPASVSKTCLVRFDTNKYSVSARAVGRPVEIFAYADRIIIKQDGEIVGEHRRRFGRGQTIYNPWHYVPAPVLVRKPGAMRNGAPFKDWTLPGALGRVQAKLAGVGDGDRQMVDLLAAVSSDGLAAVEAACAEALRMRRSESAMGAPRKLGYVRVTVHGIPHSIPPKRADLEEPLRTAKGIGSC